MSLITKAVLDCIEQSVLNDEYSSDEELVECLISQGVPTELAEQAPGLRDETRIDPFAMLDLDCGKIVVKSRRDEFTDK